jgi:hypothetical protein
MRARHALIRASTELENSAQSFHFDAGRERFSERWGHAYETRAGTRYRFVFRQSDAALSTWRGSQAGEPRQRRPDGLWSRSGAAR